MDWFVMTSACLWSAAYIMGIVGFVLSCVYKIRRADCDTRADDVVPLMIRMLKTSLFFFAAAIFVMPIITPNGLNVKSVVPVRDLTEWAFVGNRNVVNELLFPIFATVSIISCDNNFPLLKRDDSAPTPVDKRTHNINVCIGAAEFINYIIFVAGLITGSKRLLIYGTFGFIIIFIAIPLLLKFVLPWAEEQIKYVRKPLPTVIMSYIYFFILSYSFIARIPQIFALPLCTCILLCVITIAEHRHA